MNKKGDYKWGIILSLILGLMVLSLSLYFIFHELWTGEDEARQICKQSIQLRAFLPDLGPDWFKYNSFKDEYPLRCKTKIVEISAQDVEGGKVEKIIAENIAECWALYDMGDSNAFPAEVFKKSTCVPCARIHLTDEAKVKLGDGVINIRKALDLEMGNGYTYYQFLRDSGKKFSAFNFGNGVPFNLEEEGFEIDKTTWKLIGIDLDFKKWENAKLTNRLSGGVFDAKMSSTDISLPQNFLADKGDLIINYGIVTVSERNFGNYIPYLFYFQAEQNINKKLNDPFVETGSSFVFNPWATLLALTTQDVSKDRAKVKKDVEAASVAFCDTWEGIPA
jgi:hypothetical protein